MGKYIAGRRIALHKGRFMALGALIGLAAGAVVLSAGSHVSLARSPASKHGVSGAKTVAKPLTKPALHADLAQSPDPSLRKLAEYEQVYGGAVADRAMVFAGLPATSSDASNQAIDMSTKLKEFASRHIPPLVVMEPTVNGDPIALTDFAAGKYDAPLQQFFQALKAQGVTDSMMGVWVHFPEDNIPDWGNTDPKLFQTNVVKAAQAQKAVFPGSQVTILLNSQSFQTNDTDRNYGTFSSLLPYVRGLPQGLFSSFGLQGFPWVSAADAEEPASLLSPAQYLNANLAREAAKALDTKQIWFNTGTFGQMYTDDPKKTVSYTPAQRQALLNGVLAQLKVASGGGYQVSVNLFSMDSSDTGEAIDWSYWHTGQTTAQAPATATFKNFAEQVHGAGYQLWLFDSD